MTPFVCLFMQGDRQCHQEAAGRGQRRGWLHPGHDGQAVGGAEKERICQVLEEVQHDAQGVLQGGPGECCVYQCLVSYSSDEPDYDYRQEQMRITFKRLWGRSDDGGKSILGGLSVLSEYKFGKGRGGEEEEKKKEE